MSVEPKTAADHERAIRVMLQELAWYRWTAAFCVLSLGYGLFGPGTVDEMVRQLHVGGTVVGFVGLFAWLWRRKHT
jgi:hypothetical protein